MVVIWGIMEKKMETTVMSYIGFGFCLNLCSLSRPNENLRAIPAFIGSCKSLTQTR